MRRAHEVVIFSRAECHLCHDAISLVEEAGLRPTVVDIDQDDELRRRYGEAIPVVLIDGVERFRGRVDRRLLRRILI
ncbi:MAG TPA: glutaredoxin family protein [Pirellulales bacterium]|nr:glutaredoxin family protein [Pirellulales bacterium]